MPHPVRLPRLLRSVTLGDPRQPVVAKSQPVESRLPDKAQVDQEKAAKLAEEEQQTLSQLLDAFRTLDEQIGEIEQRRKQSLVEMQQAAIELSVAIASRLLHETIVADELALENIVAEILKPLDSGQAVMLRLHPTDITLLTRRLEGKPPPWQDYNTFQLVGDKTLQRGECRLDSGDIGIVSQIEMQLTEIRQQLLEALDHAQIERRRPQTGDRTLRRFPDRRETA